MTESLYKEIAAGSEALERSFDEEKKRRFVETKNDDAFQAMVKACESALCLIQFGRVYEELSKALKLAKAAIEEVNRSRQESA